ncbi:arsenate reductase ArsC [Terasakiispira papahanaumokuakeensis]|nr:arsenate reductase ArsC [Terasakiispira papahanaumokuakeensis]
MKPVVSPAINPIMKVLYLCTHNRCRSIVFEAMTRHLAGDVIEARSAGSHPAGEVHPLTLHYLQAEGVSTAGLTSQSWDAFEGFEPDVVVTVCDAAAGEQCPIWFGPVLKVHWGLDDPSAVSAEQTDAAFKHCLNEVSARVMQLKMIAEQSLSPDQQRRAIQALDISIPNH